MMQINRKSVFLSYEGGGVDVLDADGVVVASVAVPPGRSRAAQFLDLVPRGGSLDVGPGVFVVDPPSGFGVQAYGPGSHDSGANPDFRPTSASRMEREMRLTLNRMQAATTRLEARERQLAKVERVPTAKAVEPQVIEPEEPEAKAGE